MKRPPYTPADVARYVTESRRAQGLPDRITDPVVLRKLAQLVVQAERSEALAREAGAA